MRWRPGPMSWSPPSAAATPRTSSTRCAASSRIPTAGRKGAKAPRARPMPRFAANLSTLFREHDWLERPLAARRAGFEAVEIQFPYELDLDALVRAKREAAVRWLM